MHRQGCLLQQPARGPLASQLLPHLTPSSRSAGLPCRGISHRSSSNNNAVSSSSIQQPLRAGSFPPLPVPTRHLRQQRVQQQRQQQQQQQQQQRQRHVVQTALEVWPTLSNRSRSKYVNELNEEHGVPGFFEFYQSAISGQPVLYIMHPRGHTLEVQLQGATITRWLKADGEDLLHVRSDAVRQPGQPINSGIPLAFPQWRDGMLPFNGFADKLEWTVMGTEFDGEFVNADISPEEWAAGEVQLALDAAGQAEGPQPEGLLDEEDVKGVYDPDTFAQQGRRIDKYYDQQAAAAAADAPAEPGPKLRGRAAKKAKEDAAAAAEAAAAAAEAAAEAGATHDPLAAAAADADADQAAAAAAAAASADVSGSGGEIEDESEGAVDDEEDDGVDYGIIEDLAPYVILRLTDTEETRAIWPHKFELYYKITLMETDDFPDPREGLPRGLFDYNGSDVPLDPSIAALRELLESDDESLAAAAAAELAEVYRASNIRDGVLGLAGPHSEAEAESLYPLPGRRLDNGMRLFTDEDGQMNDEEALTEAEDAAAMEAAARPLRGAAAAATAKAKAKAARAAAEAAAAAAAAADSAAAEAGMGELPPGYHTPEEPPMQIKLEWALFNKDPEGSEPLSFQLGALTHFQTEDQSKLGHFVRVLGLGGSTLYDWAGDSRRPRLKGCQEDYLTFDGARHDAVYVGTNLADVMFCPGSRTHFEIFAREGLPDTVVWHPGAEGVPGLEVEPRFFAQLGSGRIALPKTLAPGEQWKGEYVVRYHEQYWEPPVFDRDGPQPMPKLVTQRDDADDREDIDEDHIVEGVVSSRLGGGPRVPSNDE